MIYALRPAEIRILKKREQLPTSRWAEQNRVLRKGPKPGPWRNHRNPAMAGVMDALCQPWVRVLVLMKGIQTGGSDGIYNFLGREADYSTGADNALVVLADEKSVKKHARKRIIPMIEDSASLAAIKSPNPDDTTIYSIRLQTGFTIEIGWSTSQVSLASDSYRIVILDELDKYKSIVNAKEAEGRTNTYEDLGKKLIKISSPGEEDGPISKAMEECDVIHDYIAYCPDCGGGQIMTWDQFRWPGQQTLDGGTAADPRAIRRDRLGWYQCEHCDSRWDDLKRNRAVAAGEWRPRTPVARPYAVGFHFPSWLSPFVSISTIIAEHLEAKDSPEALRAWYNNRAGLPFSGVAADEITAAEELFRRRYQWWPDGAPWRVPARACLLTAAVDIQDNRLEVKVMAWARGFENWTISKHLIPGSPAEDAVWEQLDEYLLRDWLHESGARLRIATVAVDTGGHHTQAAYRFLRCRLGRRVYGIKGASDSDAPLCRWSMPSRKQRRQVPLLFVGTVAAKNDLHAWMKKEDPGPGFMHFPVDLPFEAFQQLCSERPLDQRDKHGKKRRYWVKKSAGARNEDLDLTVYNYAVVSYLNPNWDKLEANLGAQARATLGEEEAAPQPSAAGRKRKAIRKRKTGYASKLKG
uniref:Uncharacterized protein n=1 Tax=Geobacter metallireducens TaxID=28232 RepID=A0A831U048_GEOME